MQSFSILPNDHHNKSNYYLSPYIDTTLVLAIFPHTIHFVPITHVFCNWKLVPLNLPHLFHSFPHPSPQTLTFLFSLSMTLFLSCYVCSLVLFFFLDYIYKWNHTVFLFLWFILVTTIPFRFIYIVKNSKVSLIFMDE